MPDDLYLGMENSSFFQELYPEKVIKENLLELLNVIEFLNEFNFYFDDKGFEVVGFIFITYLVSCILIYPFYDNEEDKKEKKDDNKQIGLIFKKNKKSRLTEKKIK